MDIFKILDTYQSEIIDVWVSRLLSDQAAPYSHENESDLRPLVSQATAAYSLVLDGGGWDELDASSPSLRAGDLPRDTNCPTCKRPSCSISRW